MRKAIPLLLLLALAGCSDPSSPSDPAPSDPSTQASFTRVETLVATDDAGSEPSLGVTPEGILFTDLGSNVYRSDDQGNTWRRMGDPNAPVPNFDPDLAVSVDGVVWESRLYIVCAAVASSRDLGETWTSNPAVCPLVGGDRQYVVPTEGCEAYVYFHQLPTFYQTATKTTDCGLTWIPTGPPEFPDHFLLANGGSGWGGGGFYNPVTGSVFFTFSYSHQQGLDNLQGASGAGFTVTRDGGLTWSAQQAAALDGRQLGLGLVTGAADDAGNVYVTWGEALGDGDDLAIFIAVSQDDGRTWGPKVRVDDGSGSKVFPVIVAGAAGHVAVAYYEGSEDAFPDDMQGTWNVTLAWTTDALADAPVFQQGQLNSAPVKEGPICISGTTCTGNREFADYFDAVRMPDGRVGATYNLLVDGDGDLRNGFALTAEPLLGVRPA